MIGKTISHYKILEKLGSGGMGIVYKAQDLKLDRHVALKFLPPHLSQDEENKRRFIQEAKAASALNHSNIATIYEIDEADGQVFIAMEYIEGVPLCRLLPRGDSGGSKPLPLEKALAYAIQIAEGLGKAHARGIIHRDIKPANILVTEDDVVKIVDFGVAKLAGRTMLTKEGTVIGTVAYMSPEQAQGREVDHRTDIWALGVVLYQMVTGEPPFKGDYEQSVIYSILHEDPAALAALRPDAPEGLGNSIAKALAKDLADRYQDMMEVLRDLRALRRRAQTWSRMGQSPEEKPIPSVAVLAFADMSPEKDQDYFCEGLAEELINALTKLRNLRVASRTSAFSFKGKQQDIREIGKKLNVETVLEGSLRKAGNRLRITAQLINVADGYHLWSERYDRDLKDVFEIQDEIVENIVQALRLVLSKKEKHALVKVSTTDVEAYDYYLRGRKFLYAARRKSLQFAIQMFTRATQVDPNYAMAYAGIADCHCWLYSFWESSDENLRKAEEASQKALKLAPSLAEAHVSHGNVLSLRKQYDEAERAFETAIHLNPRLFEAYYFYARACFPRGKLDEAARLFEEACKVRPEDYQAPLLLASVYKGLGLLKQGEETCRRGLQVAERHLELNPDDARALYLGAAAYVQLGRREQGLKWINRALEIDPEDPAILYNAACFYSNAGEVEKAIGCLEKALESGFAHKHWIEHDSDLDSIRGHQRFRALLRKMRE